MVDKDFSHSASLVPKMHTIHQRKLSAVAFSFHFSVGWNAVPHRMEFYKLPAFRWKSIKESKKRVGSTIDIHRLLSGPTRQFPIVVTFRKEYRGPIYGRGALASLPLANCCAEPRNFKPLLPVEPSSKTPKKPLAPNLCIFRNQDTETEEIFADSL